jgi:hypothetical protein
MGKETKERVPDLGLPLPHRLTGKQRSACILVRQPATAHDNLEGMCGCVQPTTGRVRYTDTAVHRYCWRAGTPMDPE